MSDILYLSDSDLPLEDLDEDALRARNNRLSEEMANWRARLSLLVNAAVQYELNRLGGSDGIEIIASVAAIPAPQLWRLLSGDYRPTAQTWHRIERILVLCQASFGVEQVIAARELFERIAELSAERDRATNRRMELARRKRSIEARIGTPRPVLQADTTPWMGTLETAERPITVDLRLEDSTEPETPFTPPAIPDLKGHDQQPNPLRATTQAKFVATMRAYHAWSGNPSYREMERRCAKRISYSTFRNMLNSRTVPKKLSSVETFVRVLGGTTEDQQRWATAWRRIAMNEFSKTERRDNPGRETTSEETKPRPNPGARVG